MIKINWDFLNFHDKLFEIDFSRDPKGSLFINRMTLLVMVEWGFLKIKVSLFIGDSFQRSGLTFKDHDKTLSPSPRAFFAFCKISIALSYFFVLFYNQGTRTTFQSGNHPHSFYSKSSKPKAPLQTHFPLLLSNPSVIKKYIHFPNKMLQSNK